MLPLAASLQRPGAAEQWSVREKLALASAVLRSGDQNWISVSRQMKHFLEPSRPEKWAAPKSCALQYGSLLEGTEATKRKRARDSGSTTTTPVTQIVHRLTCDRIEQLKFLVKAEKEQYDKLREEIEAIENGQCDDQLESMLQHLETGDDLPEIVLPPETTDLASPRSSIDSPIRFPGSISSPARPTTGSILPAKSFLTSSVSSPAGLTPSLSAISCSPPHLSAVSPLKSSESAGSVPPEIEAQKSASEEAHTERFVHRVSGILAAKPRPAPATPLEVSPSSSPTKPVPSETKPSPEGVSLTRSPSKRSQTASPAKTTRAEPAAKVEPVEDVDDDKPADIGGRKSLRSTPKPDVMKKESVEELVKSIVDVKEMTPDPVTGGRRRGRVTDITTVSSPSSTAASSPPATPSSSSLDEGDKAGKLWRKNALLVLRAAASHTDAAIFAHPVTEAIAPDYHQLIKEPTDLSTIKRQLETGVIKQTVELERALLLMFNNATMYNSPEHDVHEIAVRMREFVMGRFEQFLGEEVLTTPVDTAKRRRTVL